jgi:hypothetical protein
MSGIEVTATNIFQFISFISPFLLGFFLVMSSIFNQDLKGFIYLAGVLMSSVLNVLLKNMIRSERSADAAPVCSLLKFNILSDQNYDNPSVSSSFIAFTTAYLLLPMMFNNQMNYVVVVFLLALFIIDTMTKLSNKCTGLVGVFLGSLIGFIFGSIWFSLFMANNQENLLYFSEFVSNNTVCSRPSSQTFKCSVYKGGQLIESGIV